MATVARAHREAKMSQDTQGKWFFVFNTEGIIGLLTARCTWYLTDTDCPDGERTKVDEQPLCFVADAPCTKLFACPCAKSDSVVTYTFTDDSDIASEYVRLCDCDGHPLAQRDDPICMPVQTWPSRFRTSSTRTTTTITKMNKTIQSWQISD